MRIAEYIDTSDLREELRSWFLDQKSEVLELLATEEARVSRQKEKTATSASSQSGLRRRRKKMGGESGSEGGASRGDGVPKSSMSSSDPLEQVCTMSCEWMCGSHR